MQQATPAAIMKLLFLFTVLMTLNSCQNPSRIQAEHFSEDFERVALENELTAAEARRAQQQLAESEPQRHFIIKGNFDRVVM
jgi:hypothetical protein